MLICLNGLSVIPIAVMMIAPLHFRLSLFISLVNAASMILGQMIGDAMQSYNIAKITPDMSAEMQAQMHNHYGFVIWAGCLAVSVMLYLLWFHIRKRLQNTINETIFRKY